MSLKPCPIQPVPEETARVARAAFPQGNPYLTLRDELGSIYRDEDFAHLFPDCGQPALSPWRLALVTVMQFRENLSDRGAADAVRARIDWKYALGLELTDPGFDFSVLSEFRTRLIAGGAEELLLNKLLERSRALGLVKARGKQRTDSTHVLASIRVMNRLELVAETFRAALNELATVAPDWLRGVAPPAWYERYSRRIEDSRLPKSKAAREAYAQTVGQDGFALLDRLESSAISPRLRTLPKVQTLRQAWKRHYERRVSPEGKSPVVRFKTNKELPPAAEGFESPYDPEARFRSKRGTSWTGYMVHLSETCEDDAVELITHVETTAATVHEVRRTEAIHQALVEKELPPSQHLVDAAYIDAELLVSSQQDYGIELVGPPRQNASWQQKLDGGYTPDQFEVDWQQQRVRCPQGKENMRWREYRAPNGRTHIDIRFSASDCRACSARGLCTRAKKQGRTLVLHPQAQQEALQAARERLASEAGKLLYHRRAGVEATISQGVRAFGLRRTRYRGQAKTHLQHVATAAAINLERIWAWLEGVPRAATRTSRFAALAA
ncbi:MAG: IS1182 family transposase [Acidimicrobiia bacterium]